MTIQKNEALVRAWIDDCSDLYTRCVMRSMLAESQNPNQRDHTGPMTIELCERWAAAERKAFNEGASICEESADTLDQLARKLHPVEAQP